MAHEGLFCTSDEILVKAGANYSTGITEARINALCKQAESYINAITRYNWSDKVVAGLDADVKGLLSLAASNLVAMYIINYQMSGYSSRVEAETMLDVLRDGLNKAIDLLNEQKVKDFMVDV